MDITTTYQKTKLPNGLTIITENIPTARSVSAGVWIKAGTRQETKEINGAAHFLEHMLFKGTKRRTARTIARSLESIGGYLNAFTGKEQTCFYAEFLDEHLSKAIDILSDIVCHSTLPPVELEKERMVILDEIGSVEDTPDDLLQDIFVEKIYPDNSLGFPILGTRETVLYLTRDQILKYYHNYYTFENIIIAAAGNIQHEKLVELCLNKFDLPHHRRNPKTLSPVKTGTGEVIIPRTVNQAHVCLGTVGLPYHHHQKYELLLLNTVLGVGMGSRLFQNIREKYGLAYSIYSYLDFFKDNGLMVIYLGTDKNKKDRALRLLDREIAKLRTKPITESELKQVKAQVKGNIVLGLESTMRRMSRLAKMEIYLNEYHPINRVLDNIQNITRSQLFELTTSILNEKRLLKVAFLPN